VDKEFIVLQTELSGESQNNGTNNGFDVALVESLRKEVTDGFLDSHSRTNKNAAKALEVASFCYALVELLEEKGLITFEELDERQKAVNKRLMRKFTDQGMGVVALQEFDQDKYQFNEEVEIDCENRVHLCRAACCRLELALSKQDIEEGIVKWNLGKPYLIARDADGYCRHLDRESRRCSVWRQRPIPCRGYDCREDERVWLDFENGIVNPKLDELLSQAGEAAE
jgi:Fe-S-cluster formation regulator IscX/YfhJ